MHSTLHLQFRTIVFNLESKIVIKLYFKYHDVINLGVLNLILYCIQ